MENPKSFTIKRERLPANGLSFTETLTRSWFDDLLRQDSHGQQWVFLSDADVQIDLTPSGDGAVLLVKSRMAAEHPCVRCLSSVRFDSDFHLDLYLAEERNESLSNGSEITLEEFFDEKHHSADWVAMGSRENGYYANGIIEIAPLIRERLWLDFPPYPTCDGAISGSKECTGFALVNQEELATLK
jgi:uncharacterized metal-binding protein YceD (DUF177 family)